MAGTMGYDKSVLVVASKRSGVCLREELLAAGLSRSAVDRRVRVGLLHSIGRGVYVIDALTDARTPLHRALALVAQSVLSHLTAALLRSFPIDPGNHGGDIHVTTPSPVSRKVEGVAIHPLRRPLTPDDVEIIDGLPVTSAARTVVDVAALVGASRLRHIVQTQIRDGVLTPSELIACFEANARRGVNGIAALRRVLASLTDPTEVSGSILERALGTLLDTNGIGGFVPQYRPPWFDGTHGTVDFAHPMLRIVLEADGRRWHRRDQEMAMDRRRDRLAAAHGWATLRVTWAEVVERPAGTAAEIKAVVARRSAGAGPRPAA